MVKMMEFNPRWWEIYLFIKSNPGCGKNEIINYIVKKGIAAKRTVEKDLGEMERMGIIKVERPTRRGLKSKYYIKKIEKVAIGDIKVSLEFLSEKGISIEKFYLALIDPYKREDLSNIISAFLKSYLEEKAETPYIHAIKSVNSNRIFAVISIPDKLGAEIIEAVNNGIFGDIAKAIGSLFVWNLLYAYIQRYKDKINLSPVIWIYDEKEKTIRYDIPREIKDKLLGLFAKCFEECIKSSKTNSRSSR